MSPLAPPAVINKLAHASESSLPYETVMLNAYLRKHFRPEVFHYHQERSRGLRLQCEEPGWGFDEEKRREQVHKMNDRHVAQSFFEVNWNRGFTGRGVDPKYKETGQEDMDIGPHGKTVDELAGAQLPVSPETRGLWKAVDRGFDDGFDPLYDGPHCFSEDEDEDNAGPLGESWDEQNVDPLGENKFDDEAASPHQTPSKTVPGHAEKTQDEFQHLRSQVGHDNGKKDTKPLIEMRQSASGKMKNGPATLLEEDSNTDGRSSITTTTDQGEGSTETSPATTVRYGTKHVWSSSDGPGNGSASEGYKSDLVTTYPRPKRQRKSETEECTSKQTKRVVFDNYDDTTDEEPEAKPSLRKRKHPSKTQNSKPGGSYGRKSSFPSSGKRGSKILGQTSATIGAKGSDFLQDTDMNTESGERDRQTDRHPYIEGNQDAQDAIASTSRGTKRQRNCQHDGPNSGHFSNYGEPTPKRQRMNDYEVLLGKAQGAKEWKGDEYDMSTSNDDAVTVDSVLDDWDPSAGAMNYQARPTFFGIAQRENKYTKKDEFVPDDNEAGELIVTSVRKLEPCEFEYPKGSPRIEPDPRSWTEEEGETLRFWVQDYGIQKWVEIAWCLGRSEQDCQEQYHKVVMTRNKRAGRGLDAGLPGWYDSEFGPLPEKPAAKQVRPNQEPGSDDVGAARERSEDASPSIDDFREADEEPETDIESEPQLQSDIETEEPTFLYERPLTIEAVEPEEPIFFYERAIRIERKAESPVVLDPASITEKPVESQGSQDPPSSNVNSGRFGMICYDPKAMSFPKNKDLQHNLGTKRRIEKGRSGRVMHRGIGINRRAGH